MENNQLAKVGAPPSDMDLMTMGRVLAQSGYFKDVRSEAQAIVKVMYGRELGIAPINAVMGIHVIDGKPSLSANLIATLVKGSGKYSYRVEYWENDGCRLVFVEGSREVGPASFVEADARAAGLLSKGVWKSYPKSMYFARAITLGARAYCADVFGGAPIYTPEELGAEVDGDGNVVSSPSATPRVSTQREAAPQSSTAQNRPATHNAPAAVWNGDNESPSEQMAARKAAMNAVSTQSVRTQQNGAPLLAAVQREEIIRLAKEVFPQNTKNEMEALLPAKLDALTMAQANTVIAALDDMKRQFKRAENLSTQASPSAQEVVEGEVADAPAGAAPEGVLPMTVKKTVPAGTVAQVCRGCQGAVYFVENGKGGGAFYDSDGTPHAETCTNPQSFAKRERPETRVFAAMSEMGLPSEPREVRLAAVNAFLAENNWAPIGSFSELKDGQSLTVATAIKMHRITWGDEPRGGNAVSTQAASTQQQQAVASREAVAA